MEESISTGTSPLRSVGGKTEVKRSMSRQNKTTSICLKENAIT